MVLDKALLLKGLAGVAALGGTIGGGIVYKSLSSSKKEALNAHPPTATDLTNHKTSPEDQGRDQGKTSQSNIVVDAPLPTTTPKNTEPENELGLPQDCKYEEGSDPKTCELSEGDLKKVKFKEMGDGPTVSGLSGEQKVTLKIQKVTGGDSSSYPGGKKYIFTHNLSEAVKITNSTDPSKTITLAKTVENTFKKEGDLLGQIVAVDKKPPQETNALDEKIKDLGLPEDCTFSSKDPSNKKSIECELSKEQIKNLKFSSKGGGEFTVSSVDGDESNYKIKIEETEEEGYGTKKIRIIFLNSGDNAWNSKLTINTSTDGAEAIIIYKNSDTEFKINDNNGRLEKAWKLNDLSGLVGLKCPKGEVNNSESYCALKDSDGSIKVSIDNQAKDFKPTNSTDIESKICFKEDEDGFGQGIKFTVSSTISGTSKENSGEALNLENTYYEIKRVDGQGWRFVKNVNNTGIVPGS